MNLQNITAIAKKDLRSYIDSPTAYVVLILFLLIWQYLFFTNAFLIGEATLRGLISLVPWLFIIFIPALTMGTLSPERKDNTLELLLSHPLSTLDLVIGKFVSVFTFVSLALSFIFPIAISLSFFGSLDLGALAAQLIAAFLLAGFLSSLGIFVSSLFSNQLSSLLAAAALSFVAIASGFEFVTLSLPVTISTIVENASALTHFNSIIRGAIDLRSFYYFVSLSFTFLLLADFKLQSLRLNPRGSIFRRRLVTAVATISIIIALNLTANGFSTRLDLTANQLFTLSQSTTSVLSNLPNPVTITLYRSNRLPSQLRPILRDTLDLLKDFDQAAANNVTVEIVDPGSSPEAAARAQSAGVRQVQFNVFGNEEFQVQQGYLGLGVAYQDATEAIPFLAETNDLEFQLTSLINKLSSDIQPTLFFTTGHGEHSTDFAYRTLTQQLSNFYQILELNPDLDPTQLNLSQDIAAIIIAGPKTPLEPELISALQNYYQQGGSLLLLLDGIEVNQALLGASPTDPAINDLATAFNISLHQNVAYDLSSNELVNFGSGQDLNVLVRYPYWIKPLTHPQSLLNLNTTNQIFPWPSTLEFTNENFGATVSATPLLITSDQAATRSANTTLTPDQNFANQTLFSLNLGLVAETTFPNATSASRLVAIGDSDFLTEDFVQNNPPNLALGLEVINYLAKNPLSAIQPKSRQAPPLLFTDPRQITMVRFSNLALAVVAPLAFGVTRALRRHRLGKRTYSSSTSNSSTVSPN